MKPAKRSKKMSRRDLLQSTAGMAVGGALAVEGPAQAATAPARPNVYEAIGVKTVINATGTVTILGGSLMPPEVVAAWTEASRHFVNMNELQDKVGERIAKLVNVDAAMVTTGAAGAILLGAAAVVTRGEPERIKRLPDLKGMRSEVLIQKSHHTCYDNQLADVGVKLIEVDTATDVERAISDRTALMFFMNLADPDGTIKRADWIKLARRFQIPTLLDAAADVPPIERLAEYTRMGFDLVAVSGGKAMCGPNDTGLLVGRKDLIESAKKNSNPHCGNIGRMMKVSKEDMIALLAAVERFVRLDWNALTRQWNERIDRIEHALGDVPTLKCERVVPQIANHVPHLLLTWDEKRLKLTREALIRKLAAGDPPIDIGRVRGTGDRGVLVSVFMLQEGQDAIVAARLKDALSTSK
jgi:L-seryl-tRNA(Ser) seleniumtransferase